MYLYSSWYLDDLYYFWSSEVYCNSQVNDLATIIRPLEVVCRPLNGSPIGTHWGIYLGNNYVFHWAYEGNHNYQVKITSWTEFLSQQDDFAVLCPLIPTRRPEVITQDLIKTLQSNYGQTEYDLIENNCESLVNLIIHGVDWSIQGRSLQHMSNSLWAYDKMKSHKDEQILAQFTTVRELTAVEEQVFECLQEIISNELVAQVEIYPQ